MEKLEVHWTGEHCVIVLSHGHQDNNNSQFIGVQIINLLWVMGSLSYIAAFWLVGGLCYFVGGVLAVSIICVGRFMPR